VDDREPHEEDPRRS